jgi:hypothetical protein
VPLFVLVASFHGTYFAIVLFPIPAKEESVR